MSTLFEKRQETAARRQELRDQGLCYDGCGRPATKNKDGAMGVRCDECRKPAVKGRPVNYSDEFWQEGEETYYDRQDFKAYELQVEMTVHGVTPIPATDTLCEQPGRITIRGIHEVLGVGPGDPRRRWTLDALDSLLSVEAIGVLPTKYRKRVGVVPSYAKRSASDTMRYIFPKKIAMDGIAEPV